MTDPETQGAVERLKASLKTGEKLESISATASLADLRLVLAALAHPPSGEPTPMVLHCPECGLQHIDVPDEPTMDGEGRNIAWTNPPHCSHLCLACKHIWRPADVATVGVHSIQTSGKADIPSRVDGTRYAPPSGVGREALVARAREATEARMRAHYSRPSDSEWATVSAAEAVAWSALTGALALSAAPFPQPAPLPVPPDQGEGT